MSNQQLNVRVPADVAERLDEVAVAEMRSRSSTVRKLIVEALDRREPDVKAVAS